MSRLDQVARQDFGIRLAMMVENAGRAVAAAVRRLQERPGKLLVAAGPGNNGAGGLAAVRHLLVAGNEVAVVLSAPARDLDEVAARHLNVVERLGVRVFGVDVLDDPASVDALAEWLNGADLVVDALLGSNAKGDLRGPVRRIADSFASSGARVLSLDLPSGLDADDGTIHPGTVRADATVTLALPKVGLAKAGPTETGRVFIATLGLPAAVYAHAAVHVPLPVFDADGLVSWPSSGDNSG